ncbi:MAG: hypothetical protein WC831_01585 [Parcubacteria group bacterium]|jgi:hypothetical protein
MKISRKKVCLPLAVFLAVFLFGLAISIPSSSASTANSKTYNALKKKAKAVKLKVSVKKKTKKSSIKLTGKTGAYFTVIISVNGQEKTTLTANKKGAFKYNVPLDSAVNTVSVQATNGTITQTLSKVVKRTGKIIASPTAPIIASGNDEFAKIQADLAKRLADLAAEQARQDEAKRLREAEEAATYAAKMLELDKADYNLSIVELENDYNRDLRKLQIAYDATMEDLNNRGMTFSGGAEAVRNQFTIDCDALRAKYDADLKAIEATRYW